MTERIDVTPRTCTENSGESDGQYRRMVEMSHDIALLCDEAGQILYVNFVGAEMLGFNSQQSLVGRNISDIVHPDSLPHIQARLNQLMTEMHDLPFIEERFQKSDHTSFYGEMMAFPFFHQGNHVAHLIIRDSTRRKEAEAVQRRLKLRLLSVSALVVFLLVASGGYFFYHYTESAQFCGLQCHSVMGSRYTQHKNSTHSHVSCAGCHIGAGADWYVKAKLSGLHQVYATLTNSYPKPIPAPIENLRPAVETCEDCHSPQVFHGNRTLVRRRIADDGNASDPIVTAVTLHVGGKLDHNRAFVGIHWHADPNVKIEYQAVDRKRSQIARVRVTREDGKQTLFFSNINTAAAADAQWRTMDCSDCHNRVAHRRQTPEQTVDNLILSGALNGSLPEVKKAALASIQTTYKTLSVAKSGILNNLQHYYAVHHPMLVAKDQEAITSLADILFSQAYAPHVSPELGVYWDTYPDHIGHVNGSGCFRCHDGEHVTPDGNAIRQDCDDCHSILLDGVHESKIDTQLRDVILTRSILP
jgi:PAS domain S-box-containing protein